MKNLFFMLLLSFLSLFSYSQTPTRIHTLATGTIGDNAKLVIDQSDWTDFKSTTALALKNYCTSDFTPSDETTLEFARLNGNTFTGTVNYNVTPTTGNFLRASNSSGAMQWVSLGDYLPWASTSEVSGMSMNSVLLKPANQPIVRLMGAPINNNAQTIDYGGLRLLRQWNGSTQIEWQIATDFHSLQEVNSSTVDPYLAYVAIDDDENSAKIGITELSNLMQSINYEILVIPEWWNVGFYMVGESYDACTACIKRRNIRIFKDGTEITSTQASHFSSENITGLTSVYFTRDYNIETAAYEINMRATSTAGTYGCNGSVIWKADIIYTDPSNGISSRVTVGMSNPYVTPCNGSAITFEGAVPDGFTVVKMVDAWPTSKCEGLYFKMGSGLRYYYIEKGSCAWGFQDYAGANGACLQSK